VPGPSQLSLSLHVVDGTKRGHQLRQNIRIDVGLARVIRGANNFPCGLVIDEGCSASEPELMLLRHHVGVRPSCTGLVGRLVDDRLDFGGDRGAGGYGLSSNADGHVA